MSHARLLDQLSTMAASGDVSMLMNLAAGMLAGEQALPFVERPFAHALRRSDFHATLLEDPVSARAFHKPRGYPGDAELIDYYYDQQIPPGTSGLGARMFENTVRFPTGRAVDFRRGFAAERLEQAWQQGKRICVLACGHLREADGLAGKDLSNVVAVDLDSASLAQVAATHDIGPQLVEANALRYLRQTARTEERFDLIYTLGLTDYLDRRALELLHTLMRRCLAEKGEILVANFVSGHLSIGWMEAVMDWHLIYRDAAEMERLAGTADLQPRTFHDPTGSIVFCEMSR
jgi:hypothetical protein